MKSRNERGPLWAMRLLRCWIRGEFTGETYAADFADLIPANPRRNQYLLDLHSDAVHLFLGRLADARVVLHIVEPDACRTFRNGHAVNLVLQAHQSVEKSFRARRATRHVDVH